LNGRDLHAAMGAGGIPYNGPLIADGRLRRFKPEGDRRRNGWYVLHPGGPNSPSAAAFGCWKRGIKETWYDRSKSLSQTEWDEVRRKWQEAENERKQTEAELQSKARKTAQWILARGGRVSEHPYCVAKGVTVFESARAYKETLVIPLRDVFGVLQTLQFIAPNGEKNFLSNGKVSGAFFILNDREGVPLIICEGFATGASILAATKWAVACAMNAGNLMPVAKALRYKYPGREIVIAADNDARTNGNPGLTKATEAAREIKAKLAVPLFSEDEAGTDFNDIAAVYGNDAVESQIVQGALEVVTEPTTEAVRAVPLFAIPSRAGNDPDELLKDRYLCRGGGLLLVAATGIGKSVLALQCAILWALGREAFDIRPARPLKSLFIQAENDDGDITEARDGIIRGLNLSAEDQEAVLSRVFICREDSRTSQRFFTEVVEPLLEEHSPDLLWIDPALAFIGGESGYQVDVGAFLRNMLNPLLRKHNCAAIVVHHPNKPYNGKDKPKWTGTDLAYLGSGSIEWANWPRAVLGIISIGSHSVFQLVAGKRGSRLGWKESDGVTASYSKMIAHSDVPGVIYWRDAEPDEIPHKPGNNGKTGHTESDLLPHVPATGYILKETLISKANRAGISFRIAKGLLNELESEGRLHFWNIRRKGARPAIGISRHPQEVTDTVNNIQ
jgi:phage/plasmid primase-like uncharacterized protein